ncbi:MAG: hypothetical protein IJ418_09220 [Clostridia bacterium]|nr:hypothetical protein [Clostridia bacterium]
MNIRKALLKAKRKGSMIYRPFGERGALLVVRPPSASVGLLDCRVQYPFRKETDFHPAWTPNFADLMADDWELFSPEEK